MKSLNEYVNNELNIVSESILSKLSNAMQLLTFFAGMLCVSVDNFKIGISGAILTIISLLWFMKSHNIPIFPDDEKTNESLETIIEGFDISGMVKSLVYNLMKNDTIKSFFQEIMESDEYQKIEKSKDTEALAKYVQSLETSKKSEIENINSILSKTNI